MEIPFQRIERQHGITKYIDVYGHRVFVIYGGCIFSIPLTDSKREITLLGHRIVGKKVLTMLRTSQKKTSNSPTPEIDKFIFADRLASSILHDHADLIDVLTFDIENVNILSTLFGTLQDLRTLQFGHVDYTSNVIVLYRQPTVCKKNRMLSYSLLPGVFELSQVTHVTLPPALKNVHDHSAGLLLDYQEDTLTEFLPTNVRITDEKAVTVYNMPIKHTREKQHVSLSEHVQVRLIPATSEKPCKISRIQKKFALTLSDLEVRRLWLAIRTIDKVVEVTTFVCEMSPDARSSRDSPLNNMIPQIIQLRDKAFAVFGYPAPGQAALQKVPWAISSAQRYVLYQFICYSVSLPNDFNRIVALCESYRSLMKLDYQFQVCESENHRVYLKYVLDEMLKDVATLVLIVSGLQDCKRCKIDGMETYVHEAAHLIYLVQKQLTKKIERGEIVHDDMKKFCRKPRRYRDVLTTAHAMHMIFSGKEGARCLAIFALQKSLKLRGILTKLYEIENYMSIIFATSTYVQEIIAIFHALATFREGQGHVK
ncbi:tegument protein [Psittacid alphaherpesvirus 5]|nr:tegument protein [Psittacid alphaherpesvirus 5]